MSLKPSTQKRIDYVLTVVRDSRCLSLRQQQEERLAVAIERVLKEQDRDTRHACAEAVNALSRHPDPYDRDTGGDVLSFQRRAYAACINTQSV